MFVSDRRKKILGEPYSGFANVQWGTMEFEEDCDHTDPPTMDTLEFTEDCES